MAQQSLVKTFAQGLFNLDGRLTRGDFWVISLALSMAAGVFFISLLAIFRNAGVESRAVWLVWPILQLLIAWPGFALTVKRGHDRERSVWWTLAANVAFHAFPWILFAIGEREGAVWVWRVIGLYIVIDYGLFDGTQGPNKYGPLPKGVGLPANQANFTE